MDHMDRYNPEHEVDLEILDSFRIFDKNADGQIDLKELQKTMHELGVSLTSLEATSMLNEVDLDGDGRIDQREFKEMMQRNISSSRDALNEKDKAHKHEPEHLGDLKMAFCLFDKDKNGLIDKGEIREIMTHVGVTPSPSQLDGIIKNVDTDGDGLINFDEFARLMDQHGECKAPEVEMRQLFQAFDKDGSGYIDKQELGSTMESLGIHMTKMDVEAMLASVHIRKDGRIYYEDFVRIMLKHVGGGSSNEQNDEVQRKMIEAEVAFSLFDKDSDGLITATEVSKVMTALGVKASEEEISRMMEAGDIDCSGSIDFREFTHLMEKLKRTTARMRFFKQTSVNAELRQAFDVFDKDGNGYVDRHELRTTMRELGVDLTSDDVTAMMEEAGVRVDGRIYLEEFVRITFGRLQLGERLDSESLSKKQVTDLRIAFSLFDKDGDGKITVGELKHVTQSMNITLEFRDVERMIRKFDKDGDGCIDFQEFLSMMEELPRKQSTPHDDGSRACATGTESEALLAFRSFDKNGDGLIDVGELTETMKELGVDLSDEDAREMMKEADSNGDGLINFTEFVKMMYGEVPKEIQESRDWIKQLTETFERYDTDKDGKLTRDQFRSLLEGRKSDYTKSQVQKMMQYVEGTVSHFARLCR